MADSLSIKPCIVIIGSLNIDYVTTTPRCPSAGETLNATSLNIFPGGKGANQAVGCGKASFTAPEVQDVDVHMVGAVGADDIYVEKLLFPTLKASGVSVDGVKALNSNQTGTATIIVETAKGKGENRILFVAGANHAGMDDVKEVLMRVEHVTRGQEPDVVVMQGEVPRTTVLALLEHFNASHRKTKVVFNPAPVFEEGIPLDSLRGLAALVVNETETILLARALHKDGFDLKGADTEAQLDNESTLHVMAQQFHQLCGIEMILVTLGARGVYYSTDNGATRGLVSGVTVQKVVDTTAAGDTFVGYFAAGLARHVVTQQSDQDFDIAETVGKANVAAAKCVQRAGAMQSIPFGYE